MGTNVTGDQIKDGTIRNVDVAADAAISITKLDSAVASVTYANSVAGLAAGTVQMYAGTSAPSGWLLCQGQAVSRTTYSALFTAIGTTWGTGDGSNTFNLPDLRGRSPIGAGTGTGLSARTLGTAGGEETHKLVTSEIPVHNHADSGHSHGVGTLATANESAHTHTTTNAANFIVSSSSGLAAGSTAAAGSGAATWGQTSATAAGSAHNHTITGTSASATATIGNTGGDGTHNNMQPWICLQFIIKT